MSQFAPLPDVQTRHAQASMTSYECMVSSTRARAEGAQTLAYAQRTEDLLAAFISELLEWRLLLADRVSLDPVEYPDRTSLLLKTLAATGSGPVDFDVLVHPLVWADAARAGFGSVLGEEVHVPLPGRGVVCVLANPEIEVDAGKVLYVDQPAPSRPSFRLVPDCLTPVETQVYVHLRDRGVPVSQALVIAQDTCVTRVPTSRARPPILRQR